MKNLLLISAIIGMSTAAFAKNDQKEFFCTVGAHHTHEATGSDPSFNAFAILFNGNSPSDLIRFNGTYHHGDPTPTPETEAYPHACSAEGGRIHCKISDGLFATKVDISQNYIANQGTGYTTGNFSGMNDEPNLIVGKYDALCGWIDELPSHRALAKAARSNSWF